MSIIVNLTPKEEARLASEAMQNGLATADLAAKLLRDHLTAEGSTTADEVREKLRLWQKETATATHSATPIRDLFARWTEEDADSTANEIAENKKLWEDFKKSIDRERGNAGMRTLFSA